MGRAEPKKVMETDETNRFVRYKEIIGQGSSKAVFRGYDRERSIEVAWSRVAMKGLSKQDHRAIDKEISILASMDHPNLLTLFSWWFNASTSDMIIISELFYAGNLKHHIRRFGRPSIDTVRRWGRQVLDGLHYLHERAPGAPIIHRDLKCENIFVHGNTGQIKIGDLGLATVQDASKLGHSSVVGTANFMSPELFEGDYTLKADIYAFGMCLFEMYTGQTPYEECQHIGQVFRKIIVGERPEGLLDLDNQDLARVINSCLLPESSRVIGIVDTKLLQSNILQFRSNVNKNLCIAPGGTVNGSRLTLQPCDSKNTSPSQQWLLAQQGGLRNISAGRCMDLPNGTRVNNGPVQIWDCNGYAPAQSVKEYH